MASRRKKIYSESWIELPNLQMLKKMLEKSTQFLSSKQPCGPKSLDVSLNIAGVERIRSESMRLRSTLNAIWFEFWMKGGLFCVWFSLTQLPTETARGFFSESSWFSKKETAFSYFFLLFVLVQCLDKTFLNFIFGQSRKILSYFSKLSAILKCTRKNFAVMTSIVCLSSNR